MSLRSIQLESFEPELAPPQPQIEIAPQAFEEERLAAFEKGYTAGWDDAVAAQEREGTKLRTELAQNLQELSFTYHEARQQVLGALRPLLVDIAAKLLPAMARETLAHMVAEQLEPLADRATSVPIAVVAHPASLPYIESVMTDRASLPLVFQAEPSLGEGQVYLKFADTETRIDLDGVIGAIGAAINTYFSANQDQEEAAHG
ncbi:flagellar biosynthesis protein [Rhodobacter lacus]|uniref:Flagellar biosynthesis protein n=1 Tax=Rhodobacter lacus TaxID=1641972 RepID=A0ABW5A5P1_9RHOB